MATETKSRASSSGLTPASKTWPRSFESRTWSSRPTRVPEHTELENQLAYYRHPTDKFDPARDVTLAEVDGQVVAYGSVYWVDTNDGEYREYRVDGRVDPAWRRRGIGTALLRHNEDLARKLAADRPTERKNVFGTWTRRHADRRHQAARGATATSRCAGSST